MNFFIIIHSTIFHTFTLKYNISSFVFIVRKICEFMVNFNIILKKILFAKFLGKMQSSSSYSKVFPNLVRDNYRVKLISWERSNYTN